MAFNSPVTQAPRPDFLSAFGFQVAQKGSNIHKRAKKNRIILENTSRPDDLARISHTLSRAIVSSLKDFLNAGDNVRHVFSFLNLREIALVEKVCRAFKRALDQKNQSVWKNQCQIYGVATISSSAINYKKALLEFQPKIAYGAKQWAEFIGQVGEVPPISPKIHEVLKSPSLLWSGKTVEEAHILALIPATVNEKPLTLNLLDQLIKGGKGHGSGIYLMPSSATDKSWNIPVKKSHWVLMTKDILPESRFDYYPVQKKLVKNMDYEIPHIVDAAAAMWLHKFCSGEYLFPRTYTRCQEESDGNNLIIGDFSFLGLTIMQESCIWLGFAGACEF